MLGNLLTSSTIHEVAKNGSPVLLEAVGRAFGLGQTEQQALVQGKMPTWFWVTLGLGAGFVAGVQVYRRWPNAVPSLIRGG